ncbi:MAG: 16S rRNA (guanine(966)-N(2))-methyltransferase RsmD [Euzebya sp.]
MPRVIAGSAGGRRLKAPPGAGTRPTSDRVKEALFSSLQDVSGAVVLDLYAGSGGLAIEALSRGAATAVLVEQDRRAVNVLRDNLAVAGVKDRARVLQTAVSTYCREPLGGPFDLILLDPPYTMTHQQIARDLRALVDGGAVEIGGRLVLERDRRIAEPPPQEFLHDQDRTYGDTLLRYCTFHPDRHPGEYSEQHPDHHDRDPTS